MIRERYEELAGRALDDELLPDGAAELAMALREQPEWRRDFQQHLVLWEIWSQASAPERAADAFVAAWQTRLAAEEGAEGFNDAVHARLERQTSMATRVFAALSKAVEVLSRPMGLVYATGTLVVLLGVGIWLASSRSAQAMVTIKGEAVCTACVLHETHAHTPAVRVGTKGGVKVYYLDGTPELAELQGRFCSGPSPITVEGKQRSVKGRTLVTVNHFDLQESPKPSDDQRILFPL